MDRSKAAKKRTRLAQECAKLDPDYEKACAEGGLCEDEFLATGYEQMAKDETREQEALEWIEGLGG